MTNKTTRKCESNFIFSKSHSLYVKSVAVILMVIHHLFLFPERISDDIFIYPSIKFCGKFLQYSISSFGQICVAVFMFLSGFGFCRKYIQQNNTKEIYKGILLSVKKTYISYWKVFLIFVPIGIIFFSNNSQYCNDIECCFAYKDFSWNNFICNFIGWKCNYNREWWFLQSYLVCLLCFPFILNVIKFKSFFFDMIFFLTLYFLQIFIFPNLTNMTGFPLDQSVIYNLFMCPHPSSVCFVMGCILAKNDRLEKLFSLYDSIISSNILFNFIGLFLCFFIREYIFGNLLDFVFCIFFILFITNIFRYFSFLNKIGYFLGSHSTNIWLIHSFFIYYFGREFQKIIYFSKNQIIITVFTVLLSLLCSYFLNNFYKFLSKLLECIKYKIN